MYARPQNSPFRIEVVLDCKNLYAQSALALQKPFVEVRLGSINHTSGNNHGNRSTICVIRGLLKYVI
jgi:hypothetical protein